jgi:hypothetical protein
VSKWILVALACALLIAGAGLHSASAKDGAQEYFLVVEPGVAGVSIVAYEEGHKTVLVRGATSIDEAIRQAMIRTGKPLMLKFATP